MRLRVIAATHYGASASFHPAFESMDFGRSLYPGEALCVCLIQLLDADSACPRDTVQVSAHLLDVALREMDWIAAAADASRSGLERTLRVQLERERCMPPERYCSQPKRDERRPAALAVSRRVKPGMVAVGDECLEVLDLV